MDQQDENDKIINELYQVLMKYDLTVSTALSFLDDTKIAVQHASKLRDGQIKYGRFGDLYQIKVLPHKEP
jgi:hypothetical protein